MNTDPTLPRIVAFTGETDAGEYGATTCPHCGADGRYVLHFVCADGSHRGAMRGCVQRFPVSPLVDEHRKLLDKVRKAERGAGYGLNRWDTTKLAAIDAVARGLIDEAAALRIVARANADRDAWRTKKYGRRR